MEDLCQLIYFSFFSVSSNIDFKEDDDEKFIFFGYILEEGIYFSFSLEEKRKCQQLSKKKNITVQLTRRNFSK